MRVVPMMPLAGFVVVVMVGFTTHDPVTIATTDAVVTGWPLKSVEAVAVFGMIAHAHF